MTSTRPSRKNLHVLQTYLCALITGSLMGPHAADWPQFGGPDRNGISRETGLLKQWPEGGPQLPVAFAHLRRREA